MKKITMVMVMVLGGLSSGVMAQGLTLGARAGANFAKESISGGNSTVSFDTRTSILLGGYLTVMLTDNIGIQPELFYAGYGAKSGSETVRTNYLSIPVFFRYNVTSNVHFLAGPQFNVLVSAKDVVGSTTTDIKDQVNGLDFGLVPGVGVDFGPFNAGLRYSLGLSNISKNTSNGYSVKNNAFQVVVGYKLFGKK